MDLLDYQERMFNKFKSVRAALAVRLMLKSYLILCNNDFNTYICK